MSTSLEWRVPSVRVVGSESESETMAVGKENARMNGTIGIESSTEIAVRKTEKEIWSGSAREHANGKESEKGIGIESSIGTKVNSTVIYNLVM